MGAQALGWVLCIAGGLSLYWGVIWGIGVLLGGPLSETDSDDKWSN